MHPELIKAQIRIHGSSLAKVAREASVSRMNLSHVIHGRHRSLRIARRICELTGLDPNVAWPGRYPEFRILPIAYQSPHFQEVA